jgi:hypothetical protein
MVVREYQGFDILFSAYWTGTKSAYLPAKYLICEGSCIKFRSGLFDHAFVVFYFAIDKIG